MAESPNSDSTSTVAAFSPHSISNAPSAIRTRSAIIVHQKSPLLVATPPQVTRGLAHSHPFLLPINRLVGLISWTSGDPWESFLLVAVFWATVLYGDYVLRYGGPVLLVSALIAGMYARRFSPLSTTSTETGKRDEYRHQKSLDEIVDTLTEFTSRCNILMEPLLDLTDFLSTQQSATSATVRPALTILFIRILLITPLWAAAAVWPVQIITTKRCCLTFGTVILTYHSRAARVLRALLWRSKSFRMICAQVTGLDFSLESEGIDANDVSTIDTITPARKPAYDPKRRAQPAGVRFTFIIYENQRRWIGLGWTSSLFAYERSAWTDEQLNAVRPKDEFKLPEQEGSSAKWRWAPGSEWRIEDGDADRAKKGQKPEDGKSTDAGGWIYYDNKWQDARRGKDGWNRYTRRRKWYRDAELVEQPLEAEKTPAVTTTALENEDESRRRKNRSRDSSLKNAEAGRDSRDSEHGDREADRANNTGWGLGDEARMGLG